MCVAGILRETGLAMAAYRFILMLGGGIVIVPVLIAVAIATRKIQDDE
jgi:NaMN:DMB phosphoribosyltransferase